METRQYKIGLKGLLMTGNKYFDIADFNNVLINEAQVQNARLAFDSAEGKQAEYDVFISHSIQDKYLIKKIKQKLEQEYNISVYVDWDEDNGTPRDEIADTVKNAMKHCKSFLIVKTENSDESKWVPWETGIFEALFDGNLERMAICPITDMKNKPNDSPSNWKHQEYLKRYLILNVQELPFFFKQHNLELIKTLRKGYQLSEKFINGNIGLGKDNNLAISPNGTPTKYYGDSGKIG